MMCLYWILISSAKTKSLLCQIVFNGSQLAKMKKFIPYMSLPWNLYMEEAVGLKSSNYT